MTENWQVWLTGALGLVAVGAFVRAFPKEKMFGMVKPFVLAGAIALDALLLKWLPRVLAEKIEQGIVCSILYVIIQSATLFEDTLLKNNKSRKKNKK